MFKALFRKRFETILFFEGSLAKWHDKIPNAVKSLEQEINPESQLYREILARKAFIFRASAKVWGEGRATGLNGVFFYIKEV